MKDSNFRNGDAKTAIFGSEVMLTPSPVDKIPDGRGTIPLITLVGIWSISALNALPGLAVSPILGKLSVIFPHSTELDIQMLSSLPSLLIIPFIILSGKLTEKVNEIRLLQLGLVIFALSGILIKI